MTKIMIEKDNVILFINKDDLAQYEARGYKKAKIKQDKEAGIVNIKPIKKDTKLCIFLFIHDIYY